MRSQETRAQASTGRSSWKPPPPARDYTTPSGREESNSFKHAPPPKTRPGFEEYRANYSPNVSPHRRAQSTGAANRRGFTPATPGGDEPAAPKGAYFTQHKPQQAPEPPPRGPPPASTNNVQPDPSRQNAQPDPLRQFRQHVDPTYEPRQSTPYQTHGGEKLNPFDSAHLNRSKSHRERSDRPVDSAQVPRTGSDPHLAQPHRSRSFVDRPSKPSMASYTEEAPNSSSSDDGPEIAGESPKSSRRFAQPRRTPTGSSKNGQRMPEPKARPEHTRKPSLSQFQKWYRENPGAEPPLNGFPSDGPPTGSGQANPQASDEPNMYGTPQSHLYPSKSFPSNYNPKLQTVPETSPANTSESKGRDCRVSNPPFPRSRPSFNWNLFNPKPARNGNTPCSPIPEIVSPNYDNLGKTSSFAFSFDMNKYPNLFPKADGQPVTPPSGVAADSLNSFEADQRRLVDQLINKRHASDTNLNSFDNSNRTSAPASRNQSRKVVSESDDVLHKNWMCAQEPAAMGSPSKTQRYCSPSLSRLPDAYHRTESSFSCMGQDKSNANKDNYPTSFSFKVDDNTFAATNPRPNGFTSPSTENINTKFTPEEWEGKFEAGHDYFRPEQKAAGAPGVPARGRTHSGNRSRGRSPVKLRPVDPKAMQPHVEEETPIESPGGTKFTPEEWAQSFKPQTFMPPPPGVPPRQTSSRKGRVPSIRPTMGTAAVVDDSENTSDEKPLFTGRKTQPPPSPEPMEVDTTPPAESVETQAPKTPTSNTVPLGVPSPGKRPAAPSQSPTDSALKVEFDDLKLRDLISHLSLPAAPVPPKLPVSPTPEYTRPPKAAYNAYLKEFKAYMSDWDLFNNQFMFHTLARKKQNDELGAIRWEDDAGLEKYRLGLKEDKVVLGHWSTTQDNHQAVMKEYAVLKERMKDRNERERPRKKVY